MLSVSKDSCPSRGSTYPAAALLSQRLALSKGALVHSELIVLTFPARAFCPTKCEANVHTRRGNDIRYVGVINFKRISSRLGMPSRLSTRIW